VISPGCELCQWRKGTRSSYWSISCKAQHVVLPFYQSIFGHLSFHFPRYNN